MTKSSRALAFVSATICLTLLAGCGGSKKKDKETPTPTPTTSASSTASASPSPKPKAINPFTGGAPSRNGVVAVKIDDTGNGRPPVNLDKADIVYVEQVEGGLTRLLAIFNTTLPTVEPVRSVRANDPELLSQYGPIGFVASGGAPDPLSRLDHSSLRAAINDRGGPGFARDGSRPAPYNLSSNLAVAARGVHAPRAKDIGLAFSALDAKKLGSAPGGTSINTLVGQTGVSFRWDATRHRYLRYIGGSPQTTAAGALIGPQNVIVQFCSVTPYPRDVDVAGNVAQFTHSIGKGRAVVYRNGHALEGRWSRPSAGSGTKFVSRLGNPIRLNPGTTWILLVATNAPLSG
ncbi:MAG TPA: DUF3048 domain-containing protein [Jatrophihabitantaceae bacterium]|nr:DUF3048 domain-containing protein [Jatrophihabitantaceae bacterium]